MPQTGPDLVGAGFPTSFPQTAFLGGTANAAQGNTPSRSNLEWLGLSGAVATATLVASGVAAVVAVPVTPGYTVTKVNVPVTATAASVPTHGFAALYAGTGSAPALIGQTTDSLTTAIPASGVFSWTFASPPTITQAQAPNGFVYVAVSVTATTNPTCVTVTGPTTAAYGTFTWTTSGPLFLAATAGSSLAGTAAATIASPSVTTAVPVVYLT